MTGHVLQAGVPVLGDSRRHGDIGDPSPWPDIVGPCFTAGSIERALGVDAVVVREWTADRRLLAFQTSDGVSLYPQSQVRADRPAPGLQQVLLILQTGIDSPLMWIQWLHRRHTHARIGPYRHIDRLHIGELKPTLRAALHTAWAWRA